MVLVIGHTSNGNISMTTKPNAVHFISVSLLVVIIFLAHLLSVASAGIMTKENIAKLHALPNFVMKGKEGVMSGRP